MQTPNDLLWDRQHDEVADHIDHTGSDGCNMNVDTGSRYGTIPESLPRATWEDVYQASSCVVHAVQGDDDIDSPGHGVPCALWNKNMQPVQQNGGFDKCNDWAVDGGTGE